MQTLWRYGRSLVVVVTEVDVCNAGILLDLNSIRVGLLGVSLKNLGKN